MSFNETNDVLKTAQNLCFNYGLLPSSDSREGEKEFVENYDPSKYGLTADSVVLTADACMFATVEGILRLLLIKRGNHPYKGFWCLPGGFVDVSDRDTGVSAVRELAEETGVKGANPKYVGVFSHPWRDPRMENIVSFCYAFEVDSELVAEGADDASDAKWVNVADIFSGEITVGFDHLNLIKEAVIKIYGNELN